MKDKTWDLPEFTEGINLHGERLRLEAIKQEKKQERKNSLVFGLIGALNLALIILIISLSAAILIMTYKIVIL